MIFNGIRPPKAGFSSWISFSSQANGCTPSPIFHIRFRSTLFTHAISRFAPSVARVWRINPSNFSFLSSSRWFLRSILSFDSWFCCCQTRATPYSSWTFISVLWLLIRDALVPWWIIFADRCPTSASCFPLARIFCKFILSLI